MRFNLIDVMQEKYDIVIIGSGLGGLVSANILAREGYSVCVLEKNNQYGGNLQVFVRDKSIFDTGVHYIGALEEGQNLYRYFKYLGIIDDLKLKKMDTQYDWITFGDDERIYKHCQGTENFKVYLNEIFPKEKKAIEDYFQKIEETCNSFPLYNLEVGSSYYDDLALLSLNAKDYLDSITDNEDLKAVLVGSNLLYAGIGAKTPFYVHALSVSSYIESAYRCITGGGQIANLLVKKLKKYGGEIYKYKEVRSLKTEGNIIHSAELKDGTAIKGERFISNIDPAYTLKMLKGAKLRKAYLHRIEKIESVTSAFCLYIVFKPQAFRYLNHNYYHFKTKKRVWDTVNYDPENWPESYLVSFGVKKENEEWAENMTVISYMNFEEVKEWETTFNTVAEKGERGTSYEAFKQRKIELMLQELEKKFPNIREKIQSIHTATPLSFRDYIGAKRGAIYGYVKDTNQPLRSFLMPKSKIKNLFFTGQSLNLHGVLGVTISAFVTCSEILGKEYLLNKIKENEH